MVQNQLEYVGRDYILKQIGMTEQSFFYYGFKWANIFVFPNGDIDYLGSINIRHEPLKKLPFRNIRCMHGDLIANNCGLKTLRGCPYHVKGEFDCSFNKLSTLEHGPKRVGKDYLANDNFLVSNQFIAKWCYGEVNLTNNNNIVVNQRFVSIGGDTIY